MPEGNHRMKQESEPRWLRKVQLWMRDGAGTIFNKAFQCKQGNAASKVVSCSTPTPCHPDGHKFQCPLCGLNGAACKPLRDRAGQDDNQLLGVKG